MDADGHLLASDSSSETVDASLQIHGEQPEMMSSCASDVFVGTFLGDLGNQSHCFRGSSLRIENNS